ncbi:MAG: Ig-like domain-containing protein, partial [Bacillota bacterium]
VILSGCGNSNTGSSLSSDSNIAAVKSFSSNKVIEVAYGTPKSNILPQEVTVELRSGKEVEVPVDWNDGTPIYNGHQTGTYEFLGAFDLSNSKYKNPDNITLETKVEVMDPVKGSIYLPAQIGEEVNYSFNYSFEGIDYGEVILTLEITKIIDGDQAKDVIIKRKDKFTPKLGEEYILVEYNVTLESIEKESSSFSLSLDAFDAISKTEVSYDNLLSGIDNDLYTDLNVESTVSGYAAYPADILDEPYGVFNREIWFDISKAD